MMEGLRDTIEPPTTGEGFDQVIELKGIEQANQLLKEWGCIVPAPPSWAAHQIIKFPRTRHLLNLGAATRDDLIMTEGEQKQYLNTPIYCEEKMMERTWVFLFITTKFICKIGVTISQASITNNSSRLISGYIDILRIYGQFWSRIGTSYMESGCTHVIRFHTKGCPVISLHLIYMTNMRASFGRADDWRRFYQQLRYL